VPTPESELLALYPVLHHALRQRAITDPGGRRLSAHQATVLAHLNRTASQTLTELARQLGVALPTISLLVNRLVGVGLVRRERDPRDGRRVALRLTAGGVRAVAARSLLDPSRVHALFGLLSADEQAAALAGLATLVRAARRLPPIP
jgi:DNA-binding MarR family transcriptional regulator